MPFHEQHPALNLPNGAPAQSDEDQECTRSIGASDLELGLSANLETLRARRESDARFAFLLNCSPDMKILYRRESDGRLITEVVNRAAAERFRSVSGRDSDEFVGKGFEEILAASGLSSEAIETRRRIYEKAAETGVPAHFGSPATSVREPAEMSVYPMMDERGRCTHLLSRGRIVTEQLRTAAALQKSEERYSLVIKATNDGIFDWDLAAKDSHLSSRFKAMLGYQDAEIGNNPETFFGLAHPEDRVALDQAVARIDSDPTVDGFVDELRLRCKDGSYRWVVSRGHVHRGPSGEPARIVGAVRDITERLEAAAKLAASERRLRNIFDALSGFVGLFTLDGRLIEANRYPFGGAGYTKEESVGHLFWETYWSDSAEEQSRIREFMARAANGESVSYETTAVMKDGRQIIVDCTNGPLRDERGEITNIIAFGVDVTRRREAEGQLVAAKKAAEAASLAKSEFLANMSHEIRTPMNAIIGLSQAVLESDLDAYQRECLTFVKSGAESLMAIIGNILEISKLQAGKVALHSHHFWPRDLVNRVMAELAADARAKKLRLTCDVRPAVPDVLLGDSECLRQVLINLVVNAIKFTPAGEVAVIVETTGRENQETSQLQFTVQDTGIGVPAEKQMSIFEAFSQVDGSSRRVYGGTGLGLAISAQLIELMGGRIWVESDGTSGSTFRISVTLQAIREPGEEIPSARKINDALETSQLSGERRGEFRHSVNERAWMKVIGPSATSLFPDVRVLDTSPHGLKIRVPELLGHGTQVEIHRADGIAIAEVRYCVEVGGEFHLGLKTRG